MRPLEIRRLFFVRGGCILRHLRMILMLTALAHDSDAHWLKLVKCPRYKSSFWRLVAFNEHGF